MKQLLFILVLLAPLLSFAHLNGHGPSAPQTRVWRYANKTTAVEGSFYFFKEGRIYVSTANDKIVSFALDELSWMDKNYVHKKLQQIESINFVEHLIPQPNNERPSLPWNTISLISLGLLLLVGWRIITKTNFQLPYLKPSMALAGFACLILFPLACSKDSSTTITTITPSTTTKNDPLVMAAAFVPYKSLVTTRSDATYFYIDCPLGLPAHNMMVGITNWQQQVPVPQAYTGSNAWSIPLTSEVATTVLSAKSNFMKGAMAIAANGIPIFNPLNNRGEDSYLIGELDNWGGHCGKADDYHYHIPPIHLSTTSGNLPIAYALDGYAVYGAKEADGSTITTLDDFHGHSATDGTYHYHGTTTYPYMIATMRGKVTLDPTAAAPENQILPQAFAKPIRPATTPLTGAKIVAFSAPTTSSYKLEYQINSKSGFINYGWDATKYSFTFIDVAGTTTTATYTK